MSEEGISEIDQLSFVVEFSKFKNLIESYRKEYLNVYSDMENTTRVLDDIDIAEKVRGVMSSRMTKIGEQFKALRGQDSLVETLLDLARKTYLPKKVNIPGSDEVHLLPEQRVFLHVKQRIESLGVCVDEFFVSVEECFEDAETQLIDQETFDGAIEAGNELRLALDMFSKDFPRLFADVINRAADSNMLSNGAIGDR